MATFTLSQEQYEALIALARKGASTPDDLRDLDAYLRMIEAANGVTRSALWIQWQEMDQPLPPNTQFPSVWPPQLRFFLELVTRPVSEADVNQVLKTKARKPTSVLVTRDPGGLVGWVPVDQFFVT